MLNFENAIAFIFGISLFLLLLFIYYYPILLFKRLNKRSDACDRYKSIKRRQYLRKAIFEALVNEEYDVNHLSWYIFNIDNEKITLGILEVLAFLGNDIFKKVDKERELRKEAELTKNDNIVCFQTFKKNNILNI